MLRSILRLGTISRVGVNLTKSITISRSFPQNVRRPVRIIGDEEESPLTEDFPEGPLRSRKKPKATDAYRRNKYDGKFYVKSQVTEEPPEPDSVEDSIEYTRPPWTVLENDYELCKYMLIVKSRSKRRQANITMLEGKRLISDALLSGVKLKALFVSRRTDIQSLPLPPSGYHLNWIPYKYISKWTDVTTSSGLLAIVDLPSLEKTLPDPNSLPLTVICDGIRDPGNMGAILRVLAGVGCKKVLITKGCVDIWEPKVLRAAAGGHFRVPIEYDVNWDHVHSRLEEDTPEETTSVFLADSWHHSGNAADTKSSDGEGGESSDSDAENVGLQKEVTEETETSSVAENVGLQKEVTEETETSSVNDRQVLQALPFYNMPFKKSGKNVLVISNEYFGPSKKAIAFTSERKGVKVHIPLCGNVESLNVVSALSVIAFEMRRQMSVS